jgi:hypothetical protein
VKTLWSEYRKRRDETKCFHSTEDANMYREGAEAALHKYGDWRVVEGLLCVTEQGDSGVWEAFIEYSDVEHGFVALGAAGDRIRIILPPEEKEPPAPILELTKKLGRERVRADKYEKALRRIARAQVDAHLYTGIAQQMAVIAEEALDEDNGA